MPRWAVYSSIVAVPAVAAVGTITVMGQASAAATTQIAITEKPAVLGWTSSGRRAQSFQITNNGANTAEVYLINPSTNAVFGEDPDVTPGASETMNVSIGDGSYAFRCSFIDGTVLNSATYSVAGGSGGQSGVAPVTEQDMEAPVADYRAYVQTSLPGLLTAAQSLDADLRAGDLAKAETDWLPAHLAYERLGAAYGTFEDFDTEINGSASGQPQGTATTSWTGFFRIEYGLWHGQSAAELAPLGDQLVTDIKGLIKAFPGQTTDPNDLPLRTHEILENALQFQLTGIQDYGSGTTLDTLYANTQGTQQVLLPAIDMIQERNAGLLTQINSGIATVQANLRCWSLDLRNRLCPPLGDLTTAQRDRVDADLSQLLETLSLVPDLLEERTTAWSPSPSPPPPGRAARIRRIDETGAVRRTSTRPGVMVRDRASCRPAPAPGRLQYADVGRPVDVSMAPARPVRRLPLLRLHGRRRPDRLRRPARRAAPPLLAARSRRGRCRGRPRGRRVAGGTVAFADDSGSTTDPADHPVYGTNQAPAS